MEPEGIVEIKFREKDLLKVMNRVDPVLLQLRAKLTEELSTDDKAKTEKATSEREKFLMPSYHQVAVHFADLHDTPERMHEKGVIVVSTFFVTQTIGMLTTQLKGKLLSVTQFVVRYEF